MKPNYKLLFLLIVVFFSCQKREWNNPFDPECSKEIWTPTEFASVQQGNAINLTWVQEIKNISGFRIERKIEEEASWTEVVSPAKTISTWADPGITGGKLYEYRIVAVAGGNQSNFATVQIKPLLTATLTTADPSAITAASALLGGTITKDGGAPITERGVCWATTTSPTTSNNKLAIGNGTGSFSNIISTLIANTTYYVRAYAINNQGTAYGNEIKFKSSLPLLLTTSTTANISSSSAILGGNIISDGNETVTERGLCYSTYINPTTSNAKLVIGSGIGIFSNTITGLTANTTYFVRAYAINSQGTAYGNEVIFKTYSLNIVTDIDGNIYHTITIGTQVWMVENLKTTKYYDGAGIPVVTDVSAWSNLTTPGYCWYNNDLSYKNPYGALYNWYAVNTGKLAPIGWHVPTDNDWTTLTTFLGGESITGGKLKETGITHWQSPNSDATNETSFTALPGGVRNQYGNYFTIGSSGQWWSSSVSSYGNAWDRFLSSDYNSLERGPWANEMGFSVRCIEGEPSIAATIPTLNTLTESNVTSTTAVLGGNITSDGGSSITVKGVCWNTTSGPTITNSKTSDGSGVGNFTSNLTGLVANTTYYVRAYATNGQGTAYGNEVSFTTKSDGTTGTVIDIDDNVYNTITIGSQVWMVENLKTTKYNDGTNIPNVTDNTVWNSLTTPGYCWYNNDATSYKNTYGALYNFYAVNTNKLAPKGWHVSSEAEWRTLSDYIGGDSRAAGKLKEIGTTHWLSPNTGATNETGFTALPGGYRDSSGKFQGIEQIGYWWNAIEVSAYSARAYNISFAFGGIGFGPFGMEYGFSVRCIKD